MTEIWSEDIKNALTDRIMRIAPGVRIYKEASSAPEYPHFFIHQISVDDTEERRRYHRLSYSFDIRYRAASDSSTVANLQRELDSVALRLFSGLCIIECGDGKIRCEAKSCEKTDGVLHFFVTVKVRAIEDSGTRNGKLGKLSVRVGLNGR